VCKRHPKDGFSRVAADKDDLASMLDGNAARQRKPKACSLVLSFADEWLEQAGANVVWHALAVVQDLDDDPASFHCERGQNLRRHRGGAA